MRRRSLLSTLAVGAVGLAGCSSESPGGPGTTDRTRTDDTTTPPGTTTNGGNDDEEGVEGAPVGSFASVVDLETGPRTYAFSPTSTHTDDGGRVRLAFDRTATADHPARLRGQFENANDFENTFRLEWIPAVGRVTARQPHGHPYEAGLVLAPTGNNDFAARVPDYELADDGYWRLARGTDQWIPDRVRMDPGETATLEYVVLGHHDGTGRPTGTYEFRGRGESARIAVWDTEHPGPAETSRFEGRTVPPFEDDREVQWYHDADASTPSFVRPSTERTDLPAIVSFEMVNHTDLALECGHWNAYKLHDGQWFHLAPYVHTADCRFLVPGATEEWQLRAFHGQAAPCDGTGVDLGYLGGGTYAVVAGYGHETGSSGALVELVADPVDVTPTDGVTSARDGATVTVTESAWNDDEHPPSATLTLTRAEGADREILAEQVMQPRHRALRNSLSFFAAGVDEVVLRTDERAAENIVGYDADSVRFSFRGRAYEATIDRKS